MWESVGAGLGRVSTGLLMAVSGLQFLPLASSSHHKHIAFVIGGALRSLPISPGGRKRGEDGKERKIASGRDSCRKQQIEP